MSEKNESGNKQINDEFLTYNGLNRPATIMGGIPIVLGLALTGIAIFSLFILIPPFGFYGMIPAIVCGLLMMAIKIINEDDPNSLRFLLLKFNGFLIRKGKSILRVGGNE